LKGKALDWVLERVSVVDEDGNVVDRAALELPDTDQSTTKDAVIEEPAQGLEEDGE
jgi:hypothetical protein